MASTIAFCSLSLRQLNSHGSAKKLMFTTSRCWSPAYLQGVDDRLREEVTLGSLPAFSTTIVASGATPAIPMPLIGAAMVPAVCVPCPAKSWSAALSEQSPRVTCSAGMDVGVSA